MKAYQRSDAAAVCTSLVARVSAPFLSNVPPRSLVLDALQHLDYACLMRVPGNASVFQCLADKAYIYLFSDFRIGKVSSHHIEGFGTQLALTCCT